jgi:hypothetical protein
MFLYQSLSYLYPVYYSIDISMGNISFIERYLDITHLLMQLPA